MFTCLASETVLPCSPQFLSCYAVLGLSTFPCCLSPLALLPPSLSAPGRLSRSLTTPLTVFKGGVSSCRQPLRLCDVKTRICRSVTLVQVRMPVRTLALHVCFFPSSLNAAAYIFSSISLFVVFSLDHFAYSTSVRTENPFPLYRYRSMRRTRAPYLLPCHATCHWDDLVRCTYLAMFSWAVPAASN
jgi:hypothetical protein